jgi:sulfate/thiosulfate transport system permease protein
VTSAVVTGGGVAGATSPPERSRSRQPGARAGGLTPGVGIGGGLIVLFLSVVVLLPLAAVVWRSGDAGASGFWHAVTAPETKSAIELTVVMSLGVAVVNLVMGTVVAWVLVRDKLPGHQVLDALIDLPFALPTIVAGLTLLVLYGPGSPVHVNLAFARTGVFVALLFVTLPFVIRTVQPVLEQLDRDMEEAAASLGASPLTVFRRIVLPNILPAMTAGTALAFARSLSEFGSTVLISGNLPFKTEVSAVNIYNQIQSDSVVGAAAESTVLLALALVVLITLNVAQRWVARRD